MVKMVNFILYIFNPSKHIGQENILPNSILKLYALFSFTTSNPTPAPTCSTCRLDSPKIRKLWTWSPGYSGRLHPPCSSCYYPLGPVKGDQSEKRRMSGKPILGPAVFLPWSSMSWADGQRELLCGRLWKTLPRSLLMRNTCIHIQDLFSVVLLMLRDSSNGFRLTSCSAP